MAYERPDPDALLDKVQRDEAKARRGRLKIFFGAAAGVGKTYAMLSEAREKKAEGVDVVVGLVETHGRSETAALLESLDILPTRTVEHRGARLKEFDLDGALARRPALILVDELAHTNAPGSRHPRRWNDIEELLGAGIDVHTTLNVQHLESLNDVVGGITQIRVHETVPDTVFEHADEVELVDIPPDDLLERLREGKVYLPQQAEHAVRNFFRKGNLIALRELALRQTAERVDAQMRDYREDAAIAGVWQASDRILVCIGPNALAERLIRAGKRLASSLHADWIVAYVETPKLERMPAAARDGVLGYLRLAEELGAETVTLSAPDMAREVLRYAREKNVSRIVLGKPRRTGWQRWLLGSVVDTIVREAQDADIYLLAFEAAGAAPPDPGLALLNRSRAYLGLQDSDESSLKRRYRGYLLSAAITAAMTLLCAAMFEHFDLANLVMVYLAGIVVIASRYGRGPSILASVLAVAAFDFFFVPPRFTFAVSDAQFIVTFVVMLLVGLVISNLAANLRSQARIAGHRERRAGILYSITRELGAARTEEEVAGITVKHIGSEFQGQSVLLFADAHGKVAHPAAQSMHHSLHGADLAVAQWVYDHGRVAGKGTDTLPGSEAVYFPVTGAAGTIAVLALLPVNLRRVFLPEQRRLMETFISQIAQALERMRLARNAEAAHVKAETESLRNALLNAISHDFRTPLAAIVGASSSLIDPATRLTDAERVELATAIHDEARRMTRLANNLLDMARLEAGSLALHRDWCSIEEIVGSVVTRIQNRLKDHPITLKLPASLPLVNLDAVLIEQVVENLLDNAGKYTPAGTPVEVGALHEDGHLVVWVADEGPGLPEGSAERLFDKFHRGEAERAQSGVGLGLTIARAIVEAHGGTITAASPRRGGAEFRVILPAHERAPEMAAEHDAATSAS